MAGEKIKAELEMRAPVTVDLLNIKDHSLAKISDYSHLILGISTWDFGELQEDWESQWDDAAALDFSGKMVALYGLGDMYGYADWFQDALGMLHDVVVVAGAQITGYWPNTPDYEFTASKALTEDKAFFVGLALDDENQFDQTDARIAAWLDSMLDEIVPAT
jgi:flavodoxin II